MNWFIFALTTYVLLVLQIGCRSLLVVDGAYPQLPLILLVFVGLSAPSRVLGWSAVVLGLLLDLQPGPIAPPIIGPHAMGYLAGAFVVVQLRNLLFRESVIAFAALVLLVGIGTELVTIAIYTMRGWPWPLGEPLAHWSATGALVHGFFSVLYTTVAAVPVGWLLMRSSGVWGFPGKVRHERRF